MSNKTPKFKLIKGGKKEFNYSHYRIFLVIVYFTILIILVCEAP